MKPYKVTMEIEMNAENEDDAIDKAVTSLVKDYVEILWIEVEEAE